MHENEKDALYHKYILNMLNGSFQYIYLFEDKNLTERDVLNLLLFQKRYILMQTETTTSPAFKAK